MLSKTLGIPLSEEKTFEATQVLIFLGIELDCRNNTAQLPQEKIEKAKLAIWQCLEKPTVTLLELQQLDC